MDKVTACAREKGIGCYDLFIIAGSAWGVATGVIKEDFKRWLKSGCEEDVPFYVRWYIRNVHGS